ncbi:hypothetical protein E2C01_008043 [Portunus trituberculatus]|uniref:Uncharacterized protein n=1 Tax=Portunus trituberculatus TaxID=210409 RepID=A0A5B7D1A0_PORTR|nr:hypothetical protein [Portunus trituberculatus]
MLDEGASGSSTVQHETLQGRFWLFIEGFGVHPEGLEIAFLSSQWHYFVQSFHAVVPVRQAENRH